MGNFICSTIILGVLYKKMMVRNLELLKLTAQIQPYNMEQLYALRHESHYLKDD